MVSRYTVWTDPEWLGTLDWDDAGRRLDLRRSCQSFTMLVSASHKDKMLFSVYNHFITCLLHNTTVCISTKRRSVLCKKASAMLHNEFCDMKELCKWVLPIGCFIAKFTLFCKSKVIDHTHTTLHTHPRTHTRLFTLQIFVSLWVFEVSNWRIMLNLCNVSNTFINRCRDGRGTESLGIWLVSFRAAPLG